MRYLVGYTAICDVYDYVEAKSEEEAIELVKRGEGEEKSLSWNRIHPDTEFFVTNE